jgi:hypothetical protein
MNLKLLTLYALYTVLLFFIFLWVVFPDKEAAELLSERLNNISEHMEVTANKVTPGMMMSCNVKQTEIILNNNVKFNIDSLKLLPNFFSLLSDKKKVAFKINNAIGLFKNNSVLFNAKGNLIEIDGWHVKGKMSLSDAVIKAEDVTLLKKLGIPMLTFSSIDFNFVRNYNKIEITDFHAISDKCIIKGSGAIFFLSKSEEIVLRLKTDIKPDSFYLPRIAKLSSKAPLVGGSKKNIELSIFGTLENPIIKL